MNAETFLDERVTLYKGDCLDVLRDMEPDSVDCVVTSPPYWGLRDYRVEGQIGLEPTMGEHLSVMVEVFEAVKRVLKPTGTLWLNYGDCYAMTTKGAGGPSEKQLSNAGTWLSDRTSRIPVGLKPKDLCMVPNRLAIALQESGWWVRSEIIWAKPNPMPESVTDRPATSHEKIFMLTKAARYFYDAGAVRVKSLMTPLRDGFRGENDGPSAYVNQQQIQSNSRKTDKQRNRYNQHASFNAKWDHMTAKEQSANGRNLRNYEPAPIQTWNIATRPFSEAHFATFPPELAERCILAGCPKGGLVLDPFGGAGTTALVALRHNRNAALIELNDEYAAMARARIEAEWRVQPKQDAPDFGPLFEAMP